MDTGHIYTLDPLNEERVRFPNLRLWSGAISFHSHHWKDLFPIAPLLFVPVFNDALLAILIRQHTPGNRDLHIRAALREAVEIVPDLLSMKIHFWLAAWLWSYLPLYGWMKDLEERTNWALASNVIAFEGLIGVIGRDRCKQLTHQMPPASSIRVLVTIPALIIATCMVIIAISAFFLDTSLFFWTCGIIIAWTLIPGSSTVNSLLYLSIPSVRATLSNKLGEVPTVLQFGDVCVKCAHFDHLHGLCLRFQVAVKRYPKHFRACCNALYFTRAQSLPDIILCPHCSTNLELDELERTRFTFKCPECSTFTDWSHPT
jgi:hypothetical protein